MSGLHEGDTIEQPRISEATIRTIAQAEGYISGICFKTGPPGRVGAELEWTVHHADDPGRPLDVAVLGPALAPHTPSTLDPNADPLPLPSGAVLTVEPGGQVEISTQPVRTLTELHAAVTADRHHLTALLARAGLRLGEFAVDPWRPPRRLLHTARYDTMADTFRSYGPHGATMMCSTAAVQVCLDAGRPERIAARWTALHSVGPVLLALFANSPRHAGVDTGWASTRMRSWLGMDPGRTAPVPVTGDPATQWTRYALRAPILGVLRDGRPTPAPAEVTFADWIRGALPDPPTLADLDFHLSTLFPPVRPRGYLEVRYLDAQPGDEWLAPVALVTALFDDEPTVDAVRDLSAPAAGRWHEAARAGLADRQLALTARKVAELALGRLAGTGLPQGLQADVHEMVGRRLAGGGRHA
ncbi:MAG: ergothioneine biosynthesis glutamate--cysteine ligase EgtA [Actinobacteria bacterium]|nr:MAG: ergothioneine biosynthesis glutamate--cysteine ligase EgtA [Actinomycetota bacterium]